MMSTESHAPVHLLHKDTLDLLVFGYCRSEQQLLNDKDIPDPIIHIISEFLLFMEYFFNPSKNITIKDNDPTTIIHTGESSCNDGMAFGAALIDTNELAIYEWTFRINKGREFDWDNCEYNDFICIGLKANMSSTVWNNGFCEFDNLGDIYSDGKIAKKKDYNDKNTVKFGQDSKVKMVLNLFTKMVSYQIDDQDLGIAFTRIPTNAQYRMAVTIWKKDDSVSLIDFKVETEF